MKNFTLKKVFINWMNFSDAWFNLQFDDLWYDGGVVVPHHQHQVLEVGQHLLVRLVLKLALVVQVSQVVRSWLGGFFFKPWGHLLSTRKCVWLKGSCQYWAGATRSCWVPKEEFQRSLKPGSKAHKPQERSIDAPSRIEGHFPPKVKVFQSKKKLESTGTSASHSGIPNTPWWGDPKVTRFLRWA